MSLEYLIDKFCKMQINYSNELSYIDYFEK